MKSKGGEKAVVNPLVLLCLIDSIVLFLFPGGNDFTSAPLPHRKVQAMNKIEPVIRTQIVKTALWPGNKCVVGASVCSRGVQVLCITMSLGN